MNKYKQKLRITYLDFDDVKNPLLAGGQSLATVAVGKRLVEKGHTVTSLCSKYPGYKDRVENGIYYKHIGLGSKFIRLNNFAYFFALPFAVPKLKTDIIIECFTAPISTMGSPLYAKAPVVGLPSQFAAVEFSRKYKLPFHWVEYLLLPYYKYFLPYTQDILTRMQKRNPTIDARIVLQGADKEYFEIKRKKAEYILFLGRLDVDQKGIDLLLAAYSKIASKAKYPLVIAGHGADQAKVEQLIKQYGLEKKVTMIGSTFGEKKLEVLSKAAFVTFASRYDDLPIFVLEALASGLPVACFDIPELKFISDKFGFKAKPFDTDEYAQVLLKAMDHPNLPQMYTDCREYAKQFSWDNTADQFEEFFYDILKKNDSKKRKVAHV